MISKLIATYIYTLLMTALSCLTFHPIQSFQLALPRHSMTGTATKIRSGSGSCNYSHNRNLLHCDAFHSQFLSSNRPFHHPNVGLGLCMSKSNSDSDTNTGVAGGNTNTNVNVNENENVNPDCQSPIFTQSKEEVHSLLVGGDLNMKLGLEDLKRCWTELGELIEFEEVFPDELKEMYHKSLAMRTTNGNDDNYSDDGKLDQNGFFAFYTFIDELFEFPVEEDEAGGENKNGDQDNDNDIDIDIDIDIDNDNDNDNDNDEAILDPTVESNKIKADLLSYLDEMTVTAKQNNQLTCGFDCTDAEREVIYDLITSLASIISPNNMVTKINTNMDKKKQMSETDAMGDWDLLYTCSHAMLINRSLSGLGRSTSAKAQFQGLRKRLSGSKYLGTAEYIETFGGGELGGDDLSFEVIITGEWYFEEKINTYTNRPAPCLKMELEKVIYGPTTNGADQWSSLGPVKLTDFLYLDYNLMILRGNANTNSLFVYRRASS